MRAQSITIGLTEIVLINRLTIVLFLRSIHHLCFIRTLTDLALSRRLGWAFSDVQRLTKKDVKPEMFQLVVFADGCKRYPGYEDKTHTFFLHRFSSITSALDINLRLVLIVIDWLHRINHYPVDSMVCIVNTYPLDSVIQPLNNRGQVNTRECYAFPQQLWDWIRRTPITVWVKQSFPGTSWWCSIKCSLQVVFLKKGEKFNKCVYKM